MQFLEAHPEQLFSAEEVGEAFGRSDQYVGTMLRRLVLAGRIDRHFVGIVGGRYLYGQKGAACTSDSS